MKREEFYQLWGHPSEKGEVKDWKEVSKFKEVVFIEFIYNTGLNARRPSLQSAPPDYVAKMQYIWSNAVTENLQKIGEKDPNEYLERSKLAKEMVQRGVPVSLRTQVVTQMLPDGSDVHGWKVYAVFEFPVEGLALYFDSKSKQKVFVFTEDGVFIQKHPPYRIRDNNSPTGWIGMTVEGDTAVTVY